MSDWLTNKGRYRAAWAEHIIGGTNVKVTDIEMIPTASHDQIWLKIERTINSTTKYYVETLARFPMENALTRENYVFSDSAITTYFPISLWHF